MYKASYMYHFIYSYTYLLNCTLISQNPKYASTYNMHMVDIVFSKREVELVLMIIDHTLGQEFL